MEAHFELYRRYALTDAEIAFIKSHGKEMC